ncbi:hypothetical protein GCM10027286_10890 [Virgibacillus ainsalahensis]
MNYNTKYVGLDVSKEKIAVADEHDHLLMNKKLIYLLYGIWLIPCFAINVDGEMMLL